MKGFSIIFLSLIVMVIFMDDVNGEDKKAGAPAAGAPAAGAPAAAKPAKEGEKKGLWQKTKDKVKDIGHAIKDTVVSLKEKIVGKSEPKKDGKVANATSTS